MFNFIFFDVEADEIRWVQQIWGKMRKNVCLMCPGISLFFVLIGVYIEVITE